MYTKSALGFPCLRRSAVLQQAICHVKIIDVSSTKLNVVNCETSVIQFVTLLPGSDEEREAFKKANHQNKLLQQQQNQGLHFAIKVSSDMRKGCDFDVFAVVTNNTQSEKKCRLVFGSCAVSYNGILGENCGFKDLLNVELSPGAGEPSLPCIELQPMIIFILDWSAEYFLY